MSLAAQIDEETIDMCLAQQRLRNQRMVVEQRRRDRNRAHDDRRVNRMALQHQEDMKHLELRHQLERQAETKRLLAEHRSNQAAMRYVSSSSRGGY